MNYNNLRVTPSQRQEVKAIFYEDPRQIQTMVIQKFTKDTGNPHKISFTFRGEAIDKLYNLLRFIKYMRLENEEKEKLDDHILEDLLIEAEDKKRYFLEHWDLVKEIAENDITRSEIVALAYRRKQLEIFENLLNDDDFFNAKAREWNKRGKEAVWQYFFERNPWIFGYGLNYIFTSQLDDKKLEQVAAGYTFNQPGKRIDALMKTRGLISTLCFVEIKTHKTELLHHKAPYRVGSWAISYELAGAVAQTQKTVQYAIEQIQTHIQIIDDSGNPTGEALYLYQPKSFVVIGSLDEFVTEKGINDQKFSSFELFRRNTVNPEIITFDELFERAKFIVQHAEYEETPQMEEEVILFRDSEIPF